MGRKQPRQGRQGGQGHNRAKIAKGGQRRGGQRRGGQCRGGQRRGGQRRGGQRRGGLRGRGGQHRGGQRARGSFRGGRGDRDNFRKNDRPQNQSWKDDRPKNQPWKNDRSQTQPWKNQNGKPFNKNKNDQQQQKPGRDNKPTNKNGKNKNLGEYSKFVGKSLFKMVPDGEDKFAALGNAEEQEEQYQQQYEDDGEQEHQFADDYEEEQQDDGADQNGEMNDEADQGEEDDEEEEGQDEGQEGQDDEEEEDEEDDEDQQNQGSDEIDYPDENQQEQFAGQAIDQNGEVEDQQNLQENGLKQQQGGENVPHIDEEEDQNVDISVIGLRIQQTLQILMNLPKLGEGKPRKYFLDRLKAYVHRYYGYNYELIDHFLGFLNPAEMVQFFEANETQRPLTIRTNTLKTRRKQLAQALIQRGVNLDPLAEWSKVGIKIYETKVPIGATPEYLAGYYMLQSASSFLPVLALDPQMNETILDMASAPGGKTSYIAQIMKNTGSVFANDLKKDRLKALEFNIHRLGISNTVITCRDGRKYPQIFPNKFDRVLLDAPCTGLGIISKDHSIKANRVLTDIYKNSHIQKQLLLAAIDSTRVGGVIVYSTCSVSPLQNQQVINYALKKRNVSIVDIDDLVEVGDAGLIKFGEKRYHVDLRKTKRIYPHVHNMDGFYLGKLVKFANGNKDDAIEKQKQNQVRREDKKKKRQEAIKLKNEKSEQNHKVIVEKQQEKPIKNQLKKDKKEVQKVSQQLQNKQAQPTKSHKLDKKQKNEAIATSSETKKKVENKKILKK